MENLRDKTVTTGSGKDVQSTDQLSGKAEKSATGVNNQVQYTTDGPPKDKLGGKNTNS